MTTRRIAVRAAWVLGEREGQQRLLPDHTVVVEGDRIADVTREPVAGAELIDVPGGIVVPGMINLHNHTLNAPLFRGIVDDLPRSATGPSKVYTILMPMGGMAVTELAPDELADLVALGLLEVAKSGATTLVDQFRPAQSCILDLARDMGLRFYGAPYMFSPPDAKTDAKILGSSKGSGEGQESFKAFHALFKQHHQGKDGRIQVILGPHASDSCGPEIFKEVDRLSRELGILATTHLAQSQAEVDAVKQRYGTDCTGYMQSCGLLRDGVIFAHGVFLTDDEIDRIAKAGAAIANCANVFLRGGRAAAYERFAARGAKVGLGTDAERMDFIAQMRTSGFVSKQLTGRGDAAPAAKLVKAATRDGADILGRSDLGRLVKGAKADLVAVDLMQPSIQPVRDPLRSLVWYASARDISAVMIDGKLVVRDGKYALGDERRIVERGARATRKIWELAASKGNMPRELMPEAIGQ
ncbi:MAG: amidohydrolase family protein [Alphaproteobacteria bacterium]|nr:amidohydrolase family protein [Alphaproteobacteria bacterium]